MDRYTYTAGGDKVPTACVQALEDYEGVWPGATFPTARTGIANAVLKAFRADNPITYEVYIGCNEGCPTFEVEERMKRETKDPVQAIDYAIMYRDANHYTEIRIKGE